MVSSDAVRRIPFDRYRKDQIERGASRMEVEKLLLRIRSLDHQGLEDMKTEHKVKTEDAAAASTARSEDILQLIESIQLLSTDDRLAADNDSTELIPAAFKRKVLRAKTGGDKHASGEIASHLIYNDHTSLPSCRR